MRALHPAEIAASRTRQCALLVERDYLARRLQSSPLVARVWPSDTNFLLIDCNDAETFMNDSMAAGLIVRDLRGNPALPASLRISVGTRAQHDALLAAVTAT